MRRRALLAVLVLLAACGPAERPGLLYGPAKTFPVDQVDSTVTYDSADALSPSRTIKVRVRAPRGATGSLPAVVVIHGGGFNTNGHSGLSDWGEQLAGAGYVTINFGNAEDEGLSHCTPLQIPLAECNAAAFEKEVAAGGTMPASMYSRPQDASAIVDQLAALEQAAGVLIDRDRLGVLGHSAGAHATLSLAGLVVDVSPSVRAKAWGVDPRFKAFVANSPQGVGRMGLIDSSWSGISGPLLIQTGSGDVTADENAASRRDPFKHLAGPDAFEHFIDDQAAQHAQFALEQDEGVAGHELALARTALAFFDAYLLGRASGREWLASGALARATGGVSTLSRK